MSEAPLMPKATAVWLVENTSLTFDQIAEFCKLHPLEVKGIADGEVATGIKGYDPISTGQLTREEIAAAEQDPDHRLHLSTSKLRTPEFKKPRGARYTPLSRRHDRPNAVLWLLRNHPELKDAQIMRLVGTTKHTLSAIRERTHWNSANLQPMDPVTLGLCSQIDLDFEVNRAAKERPKVEEDRSPDAGVGGNHHRPAHGRAREPTRSVRRPDAEAQARRRADRRQFGVRQAQGQGPAAPRVRVFAASPPPWTPRSGSSAEPLLREAGADTRAQREHGRISMQLEVTISPFPVNVRCQRIYRSPRSRATRRLEPCSSARASA